MILDEYSIDFEELNDDKKIAFIYINNIIKITKLK